MQNGNSVYNEGIVDVGILVVAIFENPLKEQAVKFLSDVLRQKKRAAIPLTTVLGAYHIATRYLKLKRINVKHVLDKLLTTRSPALYPNITPELASRALDLATYYNIESWDGYIVALAKNIGNSIIYSLDKELEKTREVTVINPFPEHLTKQYHNFVKKLLKNQNETNNHHSQ
ncbi:MAG: type II toxin-antitoxin system VapC family toxin [Candidatus Jordarchaeales archaeon]|nr:type II toxin-antitoxin system VapC family toxin [Candidatus Jordarchaeia archaeon]